MITNDRSGRSGYKIALVLPLLTLIGTTVGVVTHSTPAEARIRIENYRRPNNYRPPRQPRNTAPKKAAPPQPYVPVGAATYIGGNGSDHASGVCVLPSGEIVYGGKVTGNPFSVSAPNLLSGTTGALVKLDAAGKTVEAMAKIGSNVTDVAVNTQTSEVAASGNFGVAVLPQTLDKVRWSKSDIGLVDRLSIGVDGHVAAVSGTKVTLYDGDGTKLTDFTVHQDRLRDVAIDSRKKLVYVAGDSGFSPSIAFLAAFDYSGKRQWLDWGFNRKEVTSYPSDTYAYHVAVGKDGGLYVEGETHGTSTIFKQDPRDVKKSATHVETDAYNSLYNVPTNTTITYIAHLSATDGKLLDNSFLLARKADGSALNCRGQGGIDVDSDGTIFAGGTCDGENKGKAKITPAHPIAEAPNYTYIAIIAKGMETRKLLTTWGDGQTAGVAVGYGTAAIVATASTNVEDSKTGPLYTYNAVQGAPPHKLTDGNSTGFLATWSTR